MATLHTFADKFLRSSQPVAILPLLEMAEAIIIALTRMAWHITITDVANGNALRAGH
jgi:hypothetical protein